ncbi:hypothetical protein [Clostridium sp. ZS1]|uniref:hypothetical protein n=1 Tax=Clostridium sp. ZS1 TaxID=2949989 RepID=UPI00207AC460|nr:hypothetical protein [Clostridium sp. ZS1]
MERIKVSIDKESLKKRNFSNSVIESEVCESGKDTKSKFDYVVKILGYIYNEESLVSS